MSNLLEKASILTTPTAYDNGKILSVKPEQSLGSELITNGSFDTDLSGWTYSSGVTWNNGKAEVDALDGSFKYIEQIITSSGTKTYKISFEISNIQGSVQLTEGTSLVTEKSTNGTFEVYYKTTTTNPAIQFKRKFGTNTFFELDNVSVKEVIDADFDFTRGSSATRVNAQGLVEDVQILSSNLVQNGDFSQEGSELITNGDFSNGSTDWLNPDGAATFSNDSVTIVAGSGNSRIAQANVTSPTSAQWKLQYEITEKVGSSDLKLYTTNSGTAAYTVVPSAVGVHTFYFNSNLSTFYFNFSGTGSITIDNVSVKEVGQDWILGTGITVGENKAIFTSTASGQSVSQNAVASSLTNGALAKVSFEVLSITQGSFGVYFSGTLVGTLASAGVFTGYFTKGTETSFYIRALGTTSGSISNISVVEITDDTNLPRIDYTDGVGNLLFEQQSTNLVTYSEVYGSGTYFSSFQGSTFDNITSLSPSGENNATQLTSTGDGKLQTAGISLSQNTDYTLSFYAKNVDATSVTSRVLALGGSGGSNLTAISYFTELSTTEWKRITHSFNTGTNTTFYLYLSNALNSGGTIQIWGAQLEQSSFATSYIPTNGSTVTRLQDAAFGAGSSDLINSTEGVLYFEGSALTDTDTTNPNRGISISSGSTNNTIFIYYQAALNTLACILISNGTTQFSHSTSLFDVDDYLKIALKYKQNDFALWVNGTEIATDTSGNAPIGLNELAFDNGVGNDKFYGKAKCVAVFKEALTDEELTCLTTI